MKTILYLYGQEGLLNFQNRKIDGYEVDQISLFREDIPLIFVKILRRINYISNYFAMGKWKQGKKYDIIIIPDVYLTKYVLLYLKNHPIGSKQIIYFWNRVTQFNIDLLKQAKENEFVVCSYSKEDAQKYNMLYNAQCWDKMYLHSIDKNISETIDVYFAGYAKERYQALCAIKNTFTQLGLKVLFHIVSKSGEADTQIDSIPYTVYLNEAQQSKAILDIVTKNNYGLTLRPLEALFMHKKLITNFKDIVYYDFYLPNKDNIFILGVDNMDQLKSFVNTPFIISDFNIEKYDIESWIKQF